MNVCSSGVLPVLVILSLHCVMLRMANKLMMMMMMTTTTTMLHWTTETFSSHDETDEESQVRCVIAVVAADDAVRGSCS